MLPEYIYNIWSCGLCPALVRGGRFFDGKDLRCVYDLSDTESMPDRLERICAMRRARDRDIAFLELLRQLVKAVSVCDDWLIPASALDLRTEMIRLTESGEVRLMLAPEGFSGIPDLPGALERILNEASVIHPELRAGSILKRIRAEGISASGSFVRIERTFAALASGL